MANNQDLQEDFSQDVKDDQHFNGDDDTGENGNEHGTENGNENGNDGQNESDQAQHQGEASSGRDDDRLVEIFLIHFIIVGTTLNCNIPNSNLYILFYFY